MTGPQVDCHAHIYTRAMQLSPGAWHRPTADAPVEEYLALLDAHGVERAVMAAASIFSDGNDYAMAACRVHRRLRTTVQVAPTIGRQNLAAMAADGVIGIRLQLRNKPLPDLSSPDYRALLGQVADLGWHVHVHDDGPRLPALIAPLLASGVRLVIDHFGRPDPAKGEECEGFQAVLRAVAGGRTWVKLSGGFRLPAGQSDRLAQVLLADAGADRLLWGSDWPFAGFENAVSYADTLADLARWVPSVELRERIGHSTPLALYFDR